MTTVKALQQTVLRGGELGGKRREECCFGITRRVAFIDQVEVAQHSLSGLAPELLQFACLRSKICECEGRPDALTRVLHEVMLDHAVVGPFLGLNEVGGAH